MKYIIKFLIDFLEHHDVDFVVAVLTFGLILTGSLVKSYGKKALVIIPLAFIPTYFALHDIVVKFLFSKPEPSPGTPYRMPVVVNPLESLKHSGFDFSEQSFARSIMAGRTDITALFLDAGFAPLTPIIRKGYAQTTALHYALLEHAPNICALLQLFREHGVDLTSSVTVDLRAPATLMDVAIGTRDKDAVACLKADFADLHLYEAALGIKLRLLRKININAPKDRVTLNRVLDNCSQNILYLLGRKEIFQNMFRDENRASLMQSSFCLFRDIAYIKYLVTTFAPEQWDDVEDYIFWREQTGHNDYNTLGRNLSISDVINQYQDILIILTTQVNSAVAPKSIPDVLK